MNEATGRRHGILLRRFQPLGVLVEHRVDDVNKRLVAGKEPVPPRQQIRFQPALALMLAEHFHHAAIRTELVVLRINLRHVAAVRHFQNVLPTIRIVLVGTEEAKILGVQIQLHHVAKKLAHLPGRLGGRRAGARDIDRVVAEVRHLQIAHQQAAVGVRIVAHPPLAARGQLGQLGLESSLGVEDLFRTVAFHPLFENLDMLQRIHIPHRHLMAAPIVFAFLSVDERWAGPAFGRAEHDHRPGRPFQVSEIAGFGPNALDFRDGQIHDFSKLLVDGLRIVPLDEIGFVSHPLEKLLQFVLRNPREEAGIGDLVAVQMEDRQHGAVAGRIEKLVAVPAGGEWSGLGFAVADDASDDQIGVVERGPVGMAERIAELAPFMDAAGRFRGDVAGNSAGKAELLEQPLHSRDVWADVRIKFAVGAFQIGVGDERRAAVPRPDDIDHVQIVALDHPVEVNVEHIEPRRRAPVAKQPRLDVFSLERLFEQRIIEQIDLPDRQIIRRPPIGVHLAKLFCGERAGGSVVAGVRFCRSGHRSHDQILSIRSLFGQFLRALAVAPLHHSDVDEHCGSAECTILATGENQLLVPTNEGLTHSP